MDLYLKAMQELAAYLFLHFQYLNSEKPIDNKMDHRGLKDWKIGQVVAKL